MQIVQSASDFSGIKNCSFNTKAGLAHVVNVKLQIAAVHDCQNKMKSVFCFKSVAETHLKPKTSSLGVNFAKMFHSKILAFKWLARTFDLGIIKSQNSRDNYNTTS